VSDKFLVIYVLFSLSNCVPTDHTLKPNTLLVRACLGRDHGHSEDLKTKFRKKL
jgi:hypothetical protein